MTTPAKTEANRRNALLSTGPRTPEGKAVASLNAVSHGLLSQHVVLPDDDRTAFDVFALALVEDLAPVGELEALLVDRIVASAWRLRRLGLIEVATFQRLRPRGEAAEEGLGRAWASGTGWLTLLSRYEAGVERSFVRALHELQRLQAARGASLVTGAISVDVDHSGPGFEVER